ncbi:hypothetical protein C8J56DRAFT_587382 [Mycena floridula]|nr:hypothetical protein C8J56DRAFT_587382 [Mycena floridula]
MVIDSDLEGVDRSQGYSPTSRFLCRLVSWSEKVFRCCCFGFDTDKFGVFSTFSAFLEMVVSELTMARLHNCNILVRFHVLNPRFSRRNGRQYLPFRCKLLCG